MNQLGSPKNLSVYIFFFSVKNILIILPFFHCEEPFGPLESFFVEPQMAVKNLYFLLVQSSSQSQMLIERQHTAISGRKMSVHCISHVSEFRSYITSKFQQWIMNRELSYTPLLSGRQTKTLPTHHNVIV